MNIKFSCLLCLVSILLAPNLLSQTYPSEYYNVINRDSLYVITSDKLILFFSSPGTEGDFSFLSSIPDDFNSSVEIALNYDHFLVGKNDTLCLYDISDIHNPTLLTTQTFEFPIDRIYGFGPFFVAKTQDTLKLLSITGNSLEITEDPLIILPYSAQFNYPYIVCYRTIYKYLENFGIFEIYHIDDDCTTGCNFIAENQLYYTTFKQPYPNDPPTICGIRSRIMVEPDFPVSLNNTWWGDCIPYYIMEFYSGSKRYFYYRDWSIPPNGGRIVVNFSGALLYQHTSYDYTLQLTDVYLFQLGDNILYSIPSSPSDFNQLDYTITNIKFNKDRLTGYVLGDNYPNPFNPSTTIEYSIPGRSFVKLEVTNILGQQLRILTNTEQSAGNHTVIFNGENLPSGVYYYTLQCESYFKTKKMLLIK